MNTILNHLSVSHWQRMKTSIIKHPRVGDTCTKSSDMMLLKNIWQEINSILNHLPVSLRKFDRKSNWVSLWHKHTLLKINMHSSGQCQDTPMIASWVMIIHLENSVFLAASVYFIYNDRILTNLTQHTVSHVELSCWSRGS